VHRSALPLLAALSLLAAAVAEAAAHVLGWMRAVLRALQELLVPEPTAAAAPLRMLLLARSACGGARPRAPPVFA
jgi:hypothetical protein